MQTVSATAKNRDAYIHETVYDLPGDATLPEIAVTRLSDGRRYEIVPYVFKIRGENYYFTVFKDTEDYLALAEREERESTVVAYILLDNLQELTQYVRADYRLASTEVENILKSWVAEMNGFIREYENDKYVAVFSKHELDKQMNRDFDIQNRIMSLQIGDNSFPITVSMGIAAINGTLKEKEKAAFNALNIAIKRGGNQIAIKREDSNDYVYFGGTHKTMENNTAIVSRVSGDILEKQIRQASGVLIWVTPIPTSTLSAPVSVWQDSLLR
jgi:c-di-AMP phosphodiesterase-like protein